jgi:hypothetical protein
MGNSQHPTWNIQKMKKIPATDNALALRTDFSDEVAWQTVHAALQEEDDFFGIAANLYFVEDPEYKNLTAEQLPSVLAEDSHRTFAFIIDHTALTQKDHPILVVDFNDEPGRTFRVIPSKVVNVESNLSIANMDFAEYADNVGPDGIYRG